MYKYWTIMEKKMRSMYIRTFVLREPYYPDWWQPDHLQRYIPPFPGVGRNTIGRHSFYTICKSPKYVAQTLLRYLIRAQQTCTCSNINYMNIVNLTTRILYTSIYIYIYSHAFEFLHSITQHFTNNNI